MSAKEKVVVGMSGGVDSAVAALLLKRAGYDVIGVQLYTWRSEDVQNGKEEAQVQLSKTISQISEALGIPVHIVDVRERFRRKVVRYFLDSYSSGNTPNPCIKCNREVKWNSLLSAADDYGGYWIATGHYARIVEKDKRFCLMRGKDKTKDQSYFLSHLTQKDLSRTLFPNGVYRKEDIKAIARDAGLIAAEQPESQDLCFLEGHDYRDFLARFRPESIQPGRIIDTEGKELGTHQGLACYTIGQRRGLGVSAAQPVYVIQKDFLSNTLIVGDKSRLGRKQFTIQEVNWISGKAPENFDDLKVQIRSQARPVGAEIVCTTELNCIVRVDKLLRDITPGQFAVFYRRDLLLGGGMIKLEDDD